MQETQEHYIDLDQVDVIEQIQISEKNDAISIPCMGIEK